MDLSRSAFSAFPPFPPFLRSDFSALLKNKCKNFTDFQPLTQFSFRNLWEILGNLGFEKLPLRPANEKAVVKSFNFKILLL